MYLKKQLRPAYRLLRSKIFGDLWLETIRPIAWYNFPLWIWETIREDFKYYQPRKRGFSIARIQHLWLPKLNNPIFIVGAPRSGTTFLGECLGTDPHISYHFEPVLTKAATRYVYNRLWRLNFSQWFYRTVYSWLMRIHFDADLRFADKTPQISLIIPFLYKTFPDALFIHIIRDGRDSALSLSKKPWYRNDMKASGAKEPDGYPFGPTARFWVEQDRVKEYETTDDIHRCLWLWRRYVEIILEAVPQIPPAQYHELRYESLVQNPELEAEKLIDFLEITKAESRRNLKATFVSRANPHSVGNWRKELSSEQLGSVEKEAGVLLKTLKYMA